ncbi:MAG TPA: FAD-binding oxidoreductase [Candidatus Saccharimonadales bacterium]|nr:FAD-binding oxidoreductase [Candidatus Saccharimonadales bacterium]
MDAFYRSLKQKGFEGDIDDSEESRQLFSHDASLFELVPKVVVAPKNTRDLERLVDAVNECRGEIPDLSLTGRGAGTDMSGGAISESVIVDFRKYFTKVESVSEFAAHVQPGVLYRDFEAKTLKHRALMPTYPASRDMASVGGMVNNNSGGEKSLQYGKTQDFVTELKVVFSDGKARSVRPLSRAELDKKMKQKDFEGQVYKKLFHLIDDNYDLIKKAKPHVSKNSAGYYLWDVWDRETGVFDLTQLICGAQGTLGLVSDIHFKLVRAQPHSGLLVLFLKDIDDLGELIPKVLEAKPATFESFDDATMFLGIRFMPSFHKMLGWLGVVKLLLSFISTGWHVNAWRGIPKLILMVEFNGETEEEVRRKVKGLHRVLSRHRARYEINGFEEDATEGKSEKFWLMRRYSFQLLRSKVKDKHTAPFIDDFIVRPEYLTQFLPKLRKIIKKYNLFATIAGHMGDGNFHVIPLMKIENPPERAKLEPAMKEVNKLVLKYGGSLTAEHNDGMIRGPWLTQMYGRRVVDLFRQAKHIMDPADIFNPHKKADADWSYSSSHIREKF